FLDLKDDLALALPEVSVQLSVRALLQGVIAPTVIKIRDAYLYLVRQKDGSIYLKYATAAPAEGAAPGTQVGAALPEFLNRLVPAPDPGDPLTLLNEVLVESSTVFILDEKANRTWRFPLSSLALERDELGLNGELALTLGSGDDAPSLEAAFLYDKETEILDLSAGFRDVAPGELADAFEALTPLRALHFSLAGNISTAMDASGRFSPVAFTLEGGTGEVDLTAVERPNLAVRGLSISGRFDHEAGTLELRPARLDLGTKETAGPSVSLTATLVRDSAEANRYLVAAEVVGENVAMNDLENYWPEDMGRTARPWITGNLRDGLVDRATLRTNFAVTRPDPDAAPGDQGDAAEVDADAKALPVSLDLEMQALEGEFTFHDVAIHYFRPMPPARGVAGTASFNRDGFDVAMTAGHVGGVELTKGAVKIRGLQLKEGQIDTFEEIWIDTRSRGPVADILGLLDHEELDLLSHLGISPEGSAGTADTHLAFYFPLKKSLALGDVEVTAQSDVAGLAIRGMAMGQDITDGQAHIEINNAGMRVAGAASVAAVPFEVDWSEAFDDSKDYRTHLRAVTTGLGDAGRRALGLDFGEVLSGPLGVSLFLTLQEDGVGEAKIAANLQEVAISVPAINWHKAAGVAGEAHLGLKLRDLKPVSYDNIVLRAGDLEAEGRGKPTADGRGIETLSLERLDFPGGALKNISLALSKTPIDITITDGRIDAAYFRDEDQATADDPATPFALRAAHLTAVDFGQGRQL
ncbi:MAG TPA: DUF3971 domain-containing protein, partial [Kiloniellaceae bacterium]|nr:DUF3971 domain-containing protein [Kiloniellaceae bacterium]